MPSESRGKSLTVLDEIASRYGNEGDSAQPASKHQATVLHRIVQKLSDEADLNRCLDQLLVTVTEELSGHSAALWIHDSRDGSNVLYETSYQGKILSGIEQLGHPYAARRGPFNKKLIARTLTHGSFVIPEIRNSRLVEPEVATWMAAHGVKSLLCVLLTFGKQSVGVLTIRGAAPNAFTPPMRQLAQLLAQPVSLAVHLTQLANRAQETAVAEERTRIAEEIHDSLAQTLVEIITRLEMARQTDRLEMNGAQNSDLEDVQHLAREALAEARRAVWALAPASLEGRSLPDALKELAVKMSSRTPIEFSLRGEARPLDKENDLYRICQEAVNNALKHAGANKVQIELVYEPGVVKLTVEDDGQGFDTVNPDRQEGFGITSLRQRAARAGGQLSVLTGPNGGTRVVAELPLGGSRI